VHDLASPVVYDGSPCEAYVGDGDATEQFQRWLQARLTIVEQIEDPTERSRATKQIESAIQLVIQYRQIIAVDGGDIPPPFAEIDSPVRLVEDESVTTTAVSNDSVCKNCESAVSEDLDFCPACGEYR
jgi:hypothetical protein